MTTKIDANTYFRKKYGPFTFAIYMRGMRASKDMNQVEMAKFLGVSKSTLCDIEKGRQNVSPKLAFKIAKKCGHSEELAVKVAVDDILRNSGINFKVELIPTKKKAS